MNRRRLKSGAFTVVASLIVIAIAVVLNMIVGAIPTEYTKLDTTGMGLYDLTEGTEEMIKAVDEEVTLYLVAREGSENAIIKEFINRYAKLNEKITVETVDPEITPVFVTVSGTTFNVSTMTENTVIASSAKRSYEVGYDTIFATEYSDEEMMMYYYYGQTPTGTTTFMGEQAITGAIDNVTTDSLPKIYMLEGHGELTLDTTYTKYIAVDNYDTATLSLITGDGTVPADASALLINAPASDININELEALKSYVDAGGKLILVTGFNQTGADFTNLAALCSYYGMSAEAGMVAENSQGNYYRDFYDLVPNKSAINAITSDIEGYVLMPMAEGINIPETLPEAVTVDKLLTTSSQAYIEATDGSEAVLYSGECTVGAVATVTKGEKEGKFVWYSSKGVTDAESNYYVSGGNCALLLSTFKNVCDKKESVSIAGKAMDTDLLVVDAGLSTLWTAVFVLIVPLATIIIGIVVWSIRRKR